VVAVILTGSFISSCLAQGKYQISPELAGTEPEAPPNDTPHYGNLNGVRIAVPAKYFASVKVSTSGAPRDCTEPSLPVRYDCPLLTIELVLRRSNFAPISTHQDLLDWAGNFMRPYDKTDPSHRWFGVQFRGDLYQSTKGDLRTLYRLHRDSSTKHLGPLTCGSEYGLEHCAAQGQDPPLALNEFYFDAETAQTLIECTRLWLPHGKFLACHQYVLIPEIKAIAEIVNDSDEANSQWNSVNAAVRAIAISLRAN
jgi:hypothetical protein